MSGQKDLRELIERLQEVVRGLQTGELSLEEKVQRSEEAMKLYKQFHSFFDEREFEVRSVSFHGLEARETPFDWEGLA